MGNRWRTILFLMLLAVISQTLSGCFVLSARVSEIGLRRHQFRTTVPEGETQHVVEVETFKVECDPERISNSYRVNYFPYSNLSIDGKPLGHYSATLTAQQATFGNLAVDPATRAAHPLVLRALPDGDPFQLAQEDINIVKVHDSTLVAVGGFRDEREWYGYPSQGLMVVTIPVDFALGVVFFPIGILMDGLIGP